ncbi:MAG: hypothetical protein QNK37_15540 [Acidobacteriota bacterium]|nr:hypothetical protein [Acidobacteriota bacterium]
MNSSAYQYEMDASLPYLEPIVHTDFGEEIPYYDEELGVGQSHGHSEMVYTISTALKTVAAETPYHYISDHPVWYWDENLKKKVFFPDFSLVKTDHIKSVTAQQMLLVGEIVTTHHKAKREKDTVRMYERNQAHRVPEFLLLFPEMDDDRVLTWYVLRNGKYEPLIPKNGIYESVVIPGLAIEPIPKEDWRLGCKFKALWRGRLIRTSMEEYALRREAEWRAQEHLETIDVHVYRANVAEQEAIAERMRAKEEKQRAEAEKQRADAERQRADAEKQRADAEMQRAEAERQQAMAEMQRAEAERQQARTEMQRAEAEKQRAEAEKIRADLEKLKTEEKSRQVIEEKQRADRLEAELEALKRRLAGE